MASHGNESHFKVITQFKADYCDNHFTLYESQRTGLRVVTVDSKGPKLYGYFTLATEIHDDSGAPHTLEHLVFMGSRNYKYKGFLDKLASRAYSYTNAWTGTDQTVYTLETAGWDGFNQMLPVYLDHVITPTLTDSACYTEVHHIDGAGQDAGVVYSEMQGRQNTSYDLIELQRNRMVYPETSGFRYETGGLMERLRVLSADRIRAFHKDSYQPKNLSVIVIGEVDHSKLLETLKVFEDGLVGHVPAFDEPFQRPWMSTGHVSPFPRSSCEVVEFPEEDESRGEVSMSYLGPEYDDVVGRTAIAVLLVYLAGSPIAVLNDIMVEREHICSSISYEEEARPQLLFALTMDGVATKDLEKAKERFLAILGDSSSKPLNMNYLRECLGRHERQVVSMMERDPNNFHPSLINDHLFGHRDGSSLHLLGTLNEYKKLALWTETDWRAFFAKWFVNCHHVCIIGRPSLKLSERLEAEEAKRLKQQKDSLGEKGLQELESKLQKAQAENEQDIPSEVMRHFDPPPVETIHFIETSSACFGLARTEKPLQNRAQRYIDGDKLDSPLFLRFESVPNSFVRVNLTLCTHGVPEELRPLLQLYLENFFDTPVVRNGARIEYAQVQAELETHTVAFTADVHPTNLELISIRFNAELSKYSTVIDWVVTLLFDRIWDPERLSTTIKKILADVPEEKRAGDDMADAVSEMTLLGRGSTQRVFNTLAKDRYLRKTLLRLEREPEPVLSQMKEISRLLSDPANVRISVIADLEGMSPLPSPVSSFKALSTRLGSPKHAMRPIDLPRMGLSDSKPGDFAFVVPMKTLDSSYAVLTAKSVDSLTDPRYAAFSVAQTYLDAVEGPMWVSVRGSGLAYGTGFNGLPNKGLLTFRVYRSPDAFKAFITAKKTIEDLAHGKIEVDQFAFEGAISATVVRIADEQPTMVDAANRAFIYDVIHGVGKSWPYEFMKNVREVTQDDMKAAMKDLLLPIFDPQKASLVVTCSTTLEEKMLAGFRDYGFKAESRLLNSFEDDYGLEGELYEGGSEDDKVEDEEDEGDEEDEDEDEDMDGEGS